MNVNHPPAGAPIIPLLVSSCGFLAWAFPFRPVVSTGIYSVNSSKLLSPSHWVALMGAYFYDGLYFATGLFFFPPLTAFVTTFVTHSIPLKMSLTMTQLEDYLREQTGVLDLESKIDIEGISGATLRAKADELAKCVGLHTGYASCNISFLLMFIYIIYIVSSYKGKYKYIDTPS